MIKNMLSQFFFFLREKLYYKFTEASTLKRELMRFLFCMIVVSIAHYSMFDGINSDGVFSDGSHLSFSFWLSTALFNVCLYFLTPIFIYKVAVAWLFDVQDQFRRFLNFLASIISGACYCLALLGFSLAYHVWRLELQDVAAFAFLCSQVLLMGAAMSYFAQALIQGTFDPVLSKGIKEELRLT